MTMQIALGTKGGGMVLVSDTKIRRTEKELTDKTDLPLGIVNHSKIRVSTGHGIAIGLAGWSVEEGDLAQELADYLSAQANVSDSLVPMLTKWGDRIFQSKFPGQKHDFPICKMLIANPRATYCRFVKLRIRRDSDCIESSSYLVNGNENNSAIFWPEYFRCDKDTYDTAGALRIAAFTILMGGEVNPYGVGGLEAWIYDGAWARMPAHKIEELQTEFQAFKDSVHLAVLG